MQRRHLHVVLVGLADPHIVFVDHIAIEPGLDVGQAYIGGLHLGVIKVEAFDIHLVAHDGLAEEKTEARILPELPGHVRLCSMASWRSAACNVFSSSEATVIGPTPPGTGVIQAARSAAGANSTSPTRRPSSSRLIPTSMTMAPLRTHSPLTSPGLPTATTSSSARRTWASRPRVKRRQMVVVQPASISSRAIGRPTMLEAPTTVAFRPRTGRLLACSSVKKPLGERGRSTSRGCGRAARL